tara:strand:- start:296 stop:544 length:249 start_codon:yes stop_codon:yes gene_type:complete
VVVAVVHNLLMQVNQEVQVAEETAIADQVLVNQEVQQLNQLNQVIQVITDLEMQVQQVMFQDKCTQVAAEVQVQPADQMQVV